jgi:putative SOS response-associated peptidase YedK
VQLVRPYEAGLELVSARWGLVPTGMGAAGLKRYALFNARIETLGVSRAGLPRPAMHHAHFSVLRVAG